MDALQTHTQVLEVAGSGQSEQVRVAMIASFPVQPVVSYLGTALEEFGLPAQIWIAPRQPIQHPDAETAQGAPFQPNTLIVWLRLEEQWANRALPLTDDSSTWTDEALHTAEAMLEMAQRWHATLVFVLPAIPDIRPLGVGDAGTTKGVFATATLVREGLRRHLSSKHGVLLLDMEEIMRTIGSATACAARRTESRVVPYSDELFQLAGVRMARLIQLSRQSARKVIVVDADNTLWGGVIGEDGAEGIDLQADSLAGASFLAFQSFLLECRRAGVLLTLCSKNDEADVWKAFARPEMRLQKEHLAAWRIGWQAKSASIREIANELSLGVNSFVFIDDSPIELAEVQAALPDVACIRMPTDPSGWMQAVQRVGVLDRLPPTAEDLKRASQYEQERARKAALVAEDSTEDYRARLGIKAHVFAPTMEHLPRLAQLVAKTNQFNLSGHRRTDAELADLLADEQYIIRLAEVQDRFGDYGIVGAYIARLHEAYAEIDTFLLSCRAMGRGVEEAMIATLFDEVAQRGIPHIRATVEVLPRNEPARTFFAQLGCAPCGVACQVRRIEWPTYVARK